MLYHYLRHSFNEDCGALTHLVWIKGFYLAYLWEWNFLRKWRLVAGLTELVITVFLHGYCYPTVANYFATKKKYYLQRPFSRWCFQKGLFSYLTVEWLAVLCVWVPPCFCCHLALPFSYSVISSLAIVISSLCIKCSISIHNIFSLSFCLSHFFFYYIWYIPLDRGDPDPSYFSDQLDPS